jgi:phosphatidylserine/phosphatidylglycerophosphate/cardiolipin synthase-like enzyme
MLKNFLKSISISLVSLSTLFACSNANNLLLDNQNLYTENLIQSSSTATTNLPLWVMFNNAYKITTEENEAIGRASKNNPEKYFLGLIKSAKSYINGAFYDIDDPEATQAFIDAHKRGVKVRLITDTDNLVSKEDSSQPRKAVMDLKASGIQVIDDKRGGLMHHKFMVVDDNKVWTGSWNLTTSSMFHHNNNTLLITSKELAANFNAEFERMFSKNMFGPNPHDIPFKEVKVDDATISLYFSPRGGAQEAVLNELKKAQKSIKFMTFSLTDKDVQDIILDKKKQGLKVEGIFDDCMARNPYSLYRPFKQNGIYSLRDGNQALLHHKVIIIDDQTVITGSFNYSKNAEESNNENTLIIKSPKIVRFYNQEYGRIKYAALNNKNIPEYDHPACGGKGADK